MSDEVFNFARFLLQLLTSLVGLVLFVAAIWRDEWKLRWVRPKLVLKPKDFPGGESTLLGNPPKTPAVYWHVELINEKPWIVATNVELLLLSLSIGTAGAMESRPLSGSLSIKEKNERPSVDVGYKDAVFDLLTLTKSEGLRLRVAGRVPNNLKAALQLAGAMEMKIQARADNAVSNTLLIRVEWDGVISSSDVSSDGVKIETSEIYEGLLHGMSRRSGASGRIGF